MSEAFLIHTPGKCFSGEQEIAEPTQRHSEETRSEDHTAAKQEAVERAVKANHDG